MQSPPAVFASLEMENRRARISNYTACGCKVEQTRLWVVHRIKLWLLTQNEILGSPSPELSQARDSITQDSTGRELTKEPQEFFKDSKARDAKGRLLTCTTDPTLPELYSIPEML